MQIANARLLSVCELVQDGCKNLRSATAYKVREISNTCKLDDEPDIATREAGRDPPDYTGGPLLVSARQLNAGCEDPRTASKMLVFKSNQNNT